MNSSGYYVDLIRIKSSFLSENSGNPLRVLEAEVGRLKAEVELYKECKRKVNNPRYDIRLSDTRNFLLEKEGQLALVKQRIEDAKFEITTLEELINLEESNAGTTMA